MLVLGGGDVQVTGRQRHEGQLAPGRVVTWYHPVAHGALQLKVGQFARVVVVGAPVSVVEGTHWWYPIYHRRRLSDGVSVRSQEGRTFVHLSADRRSEQSVVR